jgi:hypothetical protein
MDNEKSVWDRLSTSYMMYAQALKDFFSGDVDHIRLMKIALMGKDRIIAIHLLQYLSQSEHLQLFDELVYLSSFSHGSIEAVRQVILAMPRDWVLENIEQTTEPLLKNGTYDEYRRLLELYLELDPEITLKLAQRAIKHEDPDIREVGVDFINKLDESQQTTK